MSKIEGAPFEEKVALCALNRIFGFEPKIGLRLVETFGKRHGRVQRTWRSGEKLWVCAQGTGTLR